MSENLEKMTVVELKALAKERGVKLSAGIAKQGIIDRLKAALAASEPAEEASEQTAIPVETPAESPRPVVRTASIITDDENEDDDPPVLTFSRNPRPVHQVVRPAAQPETPKDKPASSLASISSKAPSFTLEGSRSWHNPRTYQAQPSGYGTRSGSWNTPVRTPQDRTADTRYGQRGYTRQDTGYAQRAPQDSAYARPNTGYNRFGPETQTESRPYTPDARVQQPAYRSEYASPAENFAHQDFSAPSAQVNELLATGECGDTTGILEILSEGYGFLRTPSLCPGKNDVYVSNAQIRRFSLKNGDQISGKTRPQRDGDRYSALLYITQINGQSAEENIERTSFEDCTPVYPSRRLNLSAADLNNPLLTAMDLLCPIGYGQRAQMLTPSRLARETLIQRMTEQVASICPNAVRMLLLIDQRPEDIYMRKKAFDGEVMYSSMENSPENHIHTAELCLERAMRMAEQKADVILFVDSFTSICKAYSAAAPQGVRTLPSGIAAGSLSKAKRLFGAARALEEGGSLTIIGFFDSDVSDPVNQNILQEFCEAANMTLVVKETEPGQNKDPFIPDFVCSHTEHADLMLNEQEMKASEQLRARLAGCETPIEEIQQFLTGLHDA